MTITIREALQLPDMVQTRLVAGASGLDNQIRWVTIVELLEDTSRLQEGEFLITTGFGLAADLGRVDQFIPSLAERKLSGVAIHTGFYLREIPRSFIERANETGLPLIEIPVEMNFSTVTKAILQPIINRQFEALHYSQAIHEQMTDIAFSNGGLPAIAGELANLTRGSVSIVDAFGYEVVTLPAPLTGAAETPAAIPANSARSAQYATHSAAIRTARELYGTLSLTKPADEWQDLDHVALKQAATLCTFEYVKERAVASTEWRLQGDFAEEMLSGQIVERGDLEARSRKLGYPLNGSHIIAALRVDSRVDQNDINTLHSHFRSVLKRQAELSSIPYLLRERSQYLLLILPAHNKSQTMLQNLQAKWDKLHPAARLQVGVSRPRAEIGEFREAAEEARFAQLVYPLLQEQPAPLLYQEMSGYQFLFPFYRQPEELKQLWQPLLAALIGYDQKHGQQLVDTLDVYLGQNLNGLKTAQALYIHRHTLKYRLQQIESKSGQDLNNAAHRWQLQLALMAYRLQSLLYP